MPLPPRPCSLLAHLALFALAGACTNQPRAHNVTGPDGSPLAFSQDWSVAAQAHKESGGHGGVAGAVPRAPATRPVVNLETVLRARVKAAASPAAAAQVGLDLGRYLLMVDPVDRDQREAAAVLEAREGA